MLVLSLDSTAVSASVALVRDGGLLAEYTVNTGLTHSETLLPMVEAVLKMTHTDIDNIDLFACNAGPGSFTGVRIGAATVKGLAFGKNKPCVAVSTLDSLARNIVNCNGIVCPVMNARRQQVYNALFELNDGVLTRLTPDRAIAISELGDELVKMDKPVYLVGDGAVMTFEALNDKGFPTILSNERLLHQSAYNTAIVALEMYKNGQFVTDVQLAPTYLRPSQAERTRAERLSPDSTVQ
ncbi:MAG: tRNA (adenosine(37)-N6)-threonylcarbamoyltransferase complex dimerization subunit type 1 TsaB [Ruminococcaceae bacterium]|nr:tRNA (adenosine(37)-N6)-threonylcarbamoyltransferase complex dimerization subunit type 1 TsaB [Oscillospiraceae bacterium]